MYSIGGDANNDPGAARIGLAYRSRIKYHLSGDVTFTNPTPPTLAGGLAPFNPAVQGVSNTLNQTRLFNGGIKADITMPDLASLSYYRKLNDKWDILADVTWTGWSSIQELRIQRLNGAPDIVTPENFRNTWRASVGANYRYSDAWTFRGGLAYDQSPVKDQDRTPRLPDDNRTWLAFGVQYKFSPQVAVDAAYAHIWVKEPSINQNAGSTAANGLISGSYDSNVNIFGLQLTYTFK